MACMDICPADAVRIEDQLDACNAVIQEERCLRCRACYNVCPNNSSVQALKPKEWYQGWAAKDRLRRVGCKRQAAERWRVRRRCCCRIRSIYKKWGHCMCLYFQKRRIYL